jgi:pyruvate,water dikinase
MTLVLDLGAGVHADPALVGGKAAGLQALLDAGLPCPPAFCVTTAALVAYLDEGGVHEPSSPDAAYEAALPVALQAELAAAAARLGAPVVAVRSSAADEDSAAHSFAGLHETRLGVPPRGIAGAVRACWASLWAEGALAYRSQHGLAPGAASMAVVVQVLVPARATPSSSTPSAASGRGSWTTRSRPTWPWSTRPICRCARSRRATSTCGWTRGPEGASSAGARPTRRPR